MPQRKTKYLGPIIAIILISWLPPIAMSLIWGEKLGIFFRSGAFVATLLICIVVYNLISNRSNQKAPDLPTTPDDEGRL